MVDGQGLTPYTQSMARDKGKAEAGAAALRLATARLDLMATDLAHATGGRLSTASVRAYLKGTTLPTERNAYAVAAALDDRGARDVLRAWGFGELVPALDGDDGNASPPLKRHDDDGEREVFRWVGPLESRRPPAIGHTFSATVIARFDDRYVAVSGTGALLIIESVTEAEWRPWSEALADFQ